MARVEIPVSDTETGSSDEEFAADLALVRSPILLSDFINYVIRSVTTPSETEKPVEEVSDCLTKPVDTSAKLPKNARTTLSQSNNRLMDRISSLSDLVLLNILSYLPLETAIQTRILGKKWRNLCLPSREEFVFRQTSLSVKLYLKGVAKFLYYTMPLNTCPKITKFELKLTLFEESFRKDLLLFIINSAIVRHVKDVVLDFPEDRRRWPTWRTTCILSEGLCSYASLESLTLRHIDVDSSLKFCWTSLKALTISSVSIPNNVIANIFRGCPKLDQLELNECYDFNQINVRSRSCLRKLIIFQGKNGYKNGLFKLFLSMPQVECLVLKVFGSVQLRDISSLSDVSIDFYPLELDPYYYILSKENLYKKHLESDWLVPVESDERVWYNDRMDRRGILMELLNSVSHIKTIRLGPWCVEVVSSYVLRCLSSEIPSLKCKCLVLETPVEEWDIPGILALLRRSPCLETLVIDLTTGDNYDSKLSVDTKVAASSANTYWNKQKKIFTQFKHLKNVTIVGLSVRLVDLTKYLLEYAKYLEKMELTMSTTKKNPSFVIDRILRLPRTSPNAQILIS